MKIIKWILGILLILVVSAFLYVWWNANTFVANLLKDAVPSYIDMQYGDISINIFSGNLAIQDIDINFLNEGDTAKYADMALNSIKMEGFSYWQYIVKDKIHIKNITIIDPVTTLYPTLKSQKDSLEETKSKLKREIILDQFEISNGQLSIMKENLDSVQFYVERFDLTVSTIRTDAEMLEKKVPISYANIELEMSDLFMDISAYEKLNVAYSMLTKSKVELKDIAINSKYSKAVMSSILPRERAHMSIDLPFVVLDSIDYGYDENGVYLFANNMIVRDADLHIYLDKRLADRIRVRPMYSKIIRDLPFILHIDSTRIENMKVAYEEKKEADINAGVIYFDAINADIYQISNKKEPGVITKINAQGRIMGQSFAALDWQFDSQNLQDAFSLSGSVSNFSAASVNPILISSVKATAEGHVEQIYFTISGDDNHSSGDFKMKHRDLKVRVLQDDRSKKDFIMSLIGNIVLNDGSNADDEGFQHSLISVDRDRQKPFFNYLWLNIKDGLINIFINKKDKESKKESRKEKRRKKKEAKEEEKD